MQTTQLGRTGEQVSQLSLGTMLMGTRTDEATSFAMLDSYLDAGGSFLDTANCYAWWPAQGYSGGESETVLGRWFAKGNRDRVFLSTKGSAWVADPDYWRDIPNVLPSDTPGPTPYSGAAAGTLRRELDDSLRRLGTDHIDLYYVHVDDPATPLEETLAALDGFVQAGKIRHIGWSNVRTWRFERVLGLCERHGWAAPVALQQQHSYLRPVPGANFRSIVDDEQLSHLRANPQVSLVAYSPMLRGAYDDPARAGANPDYRGPDADARLAELTALAAELDVTPNQLAVAWLLHQTDPTPITLVGPRTPEQLAVALAAASVKLTEMDLNRLDTAGR